MSVKTYSPVADLHLAGVAVASQAPVAWDATVRVDVHDATRECNETLVGFLLNFDGGHTEDESNELRGTAVRAYSFRRHDTPTNIPRSRRTPTVR